MYNPTQEVVAGSLGYISIACWLCAQLPQVVKNISLQSCEGLSLPFLVNWLFGDLTNLIGCVLTDQLPFQTYLATYFCIIDFTLCIQYFYYRRPKPLAHHHHHQHHIHGHNHVHYASIPATAVTSPSDPNQAVTLSSPPPVGTLANTQDGLLSPFNPSPVSTTSTSTILPLPPRHKRKHSQGPGPGPGPYYHTHGHGSRSQSASQIFGADLGGLGMGITSPQLPNATDSYQDLYEAALDVARAAERVSSRRSESRRRLLSRQTTSNTMDNVYEDSQGQGDRGMMDSFHSEMSGKTESTIDDEARKRLSQSTGNIISVGGGPSGDRGRSMRRNMALTSASASATTSPLPPPPILLEDGEEDVLENLRDEVRPEITRSKSRSLSVVRTTSGKGKGRRTAGVAFMSIGLMVGYGGFKPLQSRGTGEVIGLGSSISTTTAFSPPIRHPQPFAFSTSPDPSSTHSTTFDYSVRPHDHPEPPPEPYSFKRLIGRTSAWACTTLYLTSRLPQIWKNFMRKSVEGLSIFLFFFAFCGNLTYVASILLNPAGSASPSDAGHYLLEALPYLLGSGGTLLFDMTIMIQSYMYGSSPPIPETPIITSRRKMRRKRTTTEDAYVSKSIHSQGERRPLLNHDRERSQSPQTTLRKVDRDSPVDHTA